MIKVHHEREYVAKLLETETAFWLRVLEQHWPDEGDELNRSNDQTWRIAASRYRAARLKLDRAALDEQYARAELQKLATARRTFGCGTELIRSVRRGSIDYSRVPELMGVNLEPYRKKPVEVVRINLSPNVVQSRARPNLAEPSYE